MHMKTEQGIFLRIMIKVGDMVEVISDPKKEYISGRKIPHLGESGLVLSYQFYNGWPMKQRLDVMLTSGKILKQVLSTDLRRVITRSENV